MEIFVVAYDKSRKTGIEMLIAAYKPVHPVVCETKLEGILSHLGEGPVLVIIDKFVFEELRAQARDPVKEIKDFNQSAIILISSEEDILNTTTDGVLITPASVPEAIPEVIASDLSRVRTAEDLRLMFPGRVV